MTKITKQELRRCQLLMDKKLFEQLRIYAFNKRESLSEVNRQALKKFLKEETSSAEL